MIKQLVKDGLAYLPSRVVPGIVGILSIPVFTRILSKKEFGNYLIFQTELNLIYSLCLAWIVSTAIRFSSDDALTGFIDMKKYLVKSQILAIILWSSVWYATIELIGINSLIIGVCWIVFQSNYEYKMGILRVKRQITTYSLLQILRSVIGLVLSVILINYLAKTSEYIILGYVAGILISLFIMEKTNKIYKKIKITEHPQNNTDNQYVQYGVAVIINGILTALLSYQDRIFILKYINTDAMVVYGANYDLAEKSIFFINAFILLPSSIISFKLFDKLGAKSALEFIQKITNLYIIFILPLVVFVVIFSHEIIGFVLPEDYHSGSPVLAITVIGGFFVGILQRYTSVLTLHKRTDLIMLSTITPVIVNAIMCYFLVTVYGIIGASISTLFSYMVWLICGVLLCNKYEVFRFPYGVFVITLLVSIFISLSIKFN